jgi:hypothetical protein
MEIYFHFKTGASRFCVFAAAIEFCLIVILLLMTLDRINKRNILGDNMDVPKEVKPIAEERFDETLNKTITIILDPLNHAIVTTGWHTPILMDHILAALLVVWIVVVGNLFILKRQLEQLINIFNFLNYETLKSKYIYVSFVI